MNELNKLSDLIKQRNALEDQITAIIGRPAMIGHVGEYIASKIFDISLMESANSKGIDGIFRSGSLKGKSVNIKWYTKNQRMLDINPNSLPDYYLVLAGLEDKNPESSRGKTSPWVINKAYLFNAVNLMKNLRSRGVKIGIATSITKQVWNSGEIFPSSVNQEYMISEESSKLLKFFTS
jgi:hypothetical protein